MATPETHPDDDTYYREVLHELIEQGRTLAAAIVARATPTAPTPPDAEPDPTVAFDRVARAIRRCVVLARHVAAGPARPVQAPAGPDPAARARARLALIRTVEDKIERKKRHDPATDTDALRAELEEVLLDPATEIDLQGRPVDDVIKDVCRDLGVFHGGTSNIHKRRTPAEVTHLRARAAAPCRRPPFPPGEGRGEGRPPLPTAAPASS